MRALRQGIGSRGAALAARPGHSLRLGAAVAASLFAALPAAAAEPDVEALRPLLAGLRSDNPEERLAAAYAACLVGKGDGPATDALLLPSGWERMAATDMGTIEYGSADGRLYAMFWDEAGFCMISEEGMGTVVAARIFAEVTAIAGYAAEPMQVESYCPLLRLSEDLVAELTSSGNDPVCEGETDSALRLHWGADWGGDTSQ